MRRILKILKLAQRTFEEQYVHGELNQKFQGKIAGLDTREEEGSKRIHPQPSQTL